jgi:regulator of protease activity HflC (stomatin/prohibitin superfamily)
MNTKKLKEKLQQLKQNSIVTDRIKAELGPHVREVLGKYLTITKQNFSDLEDWDIDYLLDKNSHTLNTETDSLHFEGNYGTLTLSVPIKFFIDPEKELRALKEEMEEKKRQEKLNRQRKAEEDREKEYRRYLELKQKFEEEDNA